MTQAWLWWAVLSVAGLVAVVLPDSDPPLFRLSEEHGPSLVDSAGLLALVAGWLTLDVATWRRRGMLAPRLEGLGAMAAAGTIAAAIIAWSVLGDNGAWWMLGALLLAAVQLVPAVRVTAAERSRGTPAGADPR